MLKPMMEQWRVDVSLVEKGRTHIRNGPVYSQSPSNHWPQEVCTLCRNKMGRCFYIGYALQYLDKSEKVIRMMGPGLFCDICEMISKTLTLLLKEWEVIALDKEEWEGIIARKRGFLRMKQVYIGLNDGDGSGPLPPIKGGLLSRLYFNTNMLEQEKTKMIEIIKSMYT